MARFVLDIVVGCHAVMVAVVAVAGTRLLAVAAKSCHCCVAVGAFDLVQPTLCTTIIGADFSFSS